MIWRDLLGFTWGELAVFTYGELMLEPEELLEKLLNENRSIPSDTQEKLEVLVEKALKYCEINNIAISNEEKRVIRETDWKNRVSEIAGKILINIITTVVSSAITSTPVGDNTVYVQQNTNNYYIIQSSGDAADKVDEAEEIVIQDYDVVLEPENGNKVEKD